ncbi:zinc finger, CCHC-type containing protein [Tanacetum coccineum]
MRNEVGKVKVLRVFEMIEQDGRACIYGAFVSVDTNDILMNDEFPILDVGRKITSKDNGKGGFNVSSFMNEAISKGFKRAFGIVWSRPLVMDFWKKSALNWHLEEITLTVAHFEKKQTRLRTCTKIYQEVLFSEREDDVAGIKRHRCNLSGDNVCILAKVSQRLRKLTFVCIAVDTSRETRVRRKDTIRERTRLHLFQFSLRDQASNWLERLLTGSITTWKDLTTRFLLNSFHQEGTVKLCKDILMFQQHHEESLSEAWTHQEEKVKQLEEYMGVIGSDFMQLSSEVVGKLKEEIRMEENRTKKIKKITRYPNTKDLEPLNGYKFSEVLTEKASFHTPKFVSPKSICVKHVQTIFPSPPLVRESIFGFKPGTNNNRNGKSRYDAKKLSPQSTPQVLPSFEENTPPVTYPEEVEETLGIPR